MRKEKKNRQKLVATSCETGYNWSRSKPVANRLQTKKDQLEPVFTGSVVGCAKFEKIRTGCGPGCPKFRQKTGPDRTLKH